MTDDLKQLKDALRAATPKADGKDAHLTLAMKNFDDLQTSRQGSADEARLPDNRPTIMSRLTSGVTPMLNTLTTRGALGVTTSITALGVGIFFYVNQQNATFDLPSPTPVAVNVTPETPALQNDLRADSEVAEVIAPQAPRTEAEPRTRAIVEVTERAVAEAAPSSAGLDLSDGAAGLSSAPTTVSPRPTSRKTLGSVAGAVPVTTYDDQIITSASNTEAFANSIPNPVKITTDEPVSTFSIDVDTASYAIMRSSVMNGYLPEPQSVRIEEMVNYFPYNYPAPDANEAPFKPTVTVMQTPWNSGTQLVHIGIQGEMPALEDRPALNLVFLIDTSGSMNNANKLPLLIQSFKLMLSQLHPDDEVAIVAYAGSAGQVLKPTKVSDKSAILSALTRLSAGGGTAGQQGLQQAYSVAEAMSQDGEISRVILATDGDFNVGISNPDALKTYIADKRKSGTYLSVLGFGRGNLDDATMQALAQNGNGQAAYIDTLSEAQKVLVDQLGGALFPIANDVKIQVEFNPAQIAEYRLVGYETRALAREDFNNDTVDAGEIGAGHTVTAIYEITPVGSDAVLNDSLRYQPAATATDSPEFGFLKLRYKTPGADSSQLLTTPITADMGTATDDIRFSTAIAGFGQLLSSGNYLQDWGYSELIELANANKGQDAYGYRSEAIRLMRLSQSLAEQ